MSSNIVWKLYLFKYSFMKKYFKKEVNNNKKNIICKIYIELCINKIYNENNNKLTIE